jgi:hypothetical protein
MYKKLLIIATLIASSIHADEFFAKIEPINIYQIKSQVTGKVIKANSNLESKYVSNALVVKIDDRLDLIDLNSSKKKLSLLQESLELAKEQLANTKDISDTKKSQYEKLKSLTTRSQINKDNDLFNYLTAYNQYLSTKDKIINLQTSIEDLKYKIATLEDRVENKNLRLKNKYLYKVHVKEYDFVSMGTPLVDALDISKGKLEIYVPIDIAKDIMSKKITIDDKAMDYKISKVYKVADSQRISSYKVEIEIDKPKIFSKLVKVEIE